MKNRPLKNKVRITTLDIETHPGKVLMYGTTYEPVIVKQLEFESILSISYKENDNPTKYIGLNTIKGYKRGDKNDKNLLIEISKVLRHADVLVGQNIDDFDIKKIKERLMFHRLPALPEITVIDIKKLHKQVSKLPNNKLDTISQFHGHGGKLSHEGVGLFIRCGEGDEKAWKLNEKYNKRDVDLTYKDFLDVLPYVKLPRIYNRMNGITINCSNPNCLSKNVTRDKIIKVIGGWRIQYVCSDCGKYTTDTNTLYKEKPILKI